MFSHYEHECHDNIGLKQEFGPQVAIYFVFSEINTGRRFYMFIHICAVCMQNVHTAH